MEINSTAITKKRERKPGSNGIKKQIEIAALSGLTMSLLAVIIWFLLSSNVKSIGVAFTIAALAFLALDTLFFVLLKSAAKPWKIIAAIFITVLNIAGFLSVMVYVLAPTQLFYPHFDEESYAELKTRSEAEELTVKTENGNISGWLLHNAEGKAPLVLYFCGNGENSAARMLKILDNGVRDAFAGYDIAIFDYPGYGKTDGIPSEETLKAFGLASFDAIAQRTDIDKDRIVVFGYSLGTGVADYVASKRDVDGLILMAPYADGYDLYNNFVDIFHGPMRILITFKMESVKFAQEVSVSPLLLASTSDEMVRYDSSVRLSKAFPSGCTLQTLENTKHNDFWGSSSVMEYIKEYLAEVNG